MSFRCACCGNSKKLVNVAPTRRVVETRRKAYPGGGTGFETVKEVDLCPSCAVEEVAPREKRLP
jgi:rubredoxin